jgi:hypothetical protein
MTHFRARYAWCLVLAAPLLFANSATAQRPKTPGGGGATGGPFKVGEKVEVWWLGKYYPGKITKIDNFSGWLDLEFTVDGQTRTSKHAPTGDWVRRIAGGDAAAGKNAAPAKEYPVRTWTDSTGKFKIEASYGGQDAEGVKLKKADGKTIQLALGKLSPQDQQYIAGVADAAASANPFEAATEVTSAATPADASQRDANWDTARLLAIQPVEGCSITPDPGAALPALGENRTLALAGTGFIPRAGVRGADNNFFESPKNILLNSTRGEAMVVFLNQPPGGARSVRLSRCDLKRGQYVDEIRFSGGLAPCDLSPSGQLLASLPDRMGGSDQSMIEVAKIEGGSATPKRRWNMGAWSDWSRRFEQAFFIDDERLLTISSWGGRAMLWNIDKVEAIWSLDFRQHSMPALSPGRKQLAVADSDGVAILDAATGNTLGRAQSEDGGGGTLAFSPDGKRLGSVSARRVQVWDLTTGKLTHDVWFPKQMAGKDLDFLGGNFVLVDNHFLVDLAKRVVLWEYDMPTTKGQRVGAMAGGKFWFVSGGQQAPYSLSCSTLPDAAARAKSESLNADDVLALKPGARVSLAINLPGDDDVKRAVKNLTERLRANGMVVADNAPLVLEALITAGTSETVSYRHFGSFTPSEQATVSKQISLLTLKENGKELWRASGSFGGHAPGIVRVKQGQSVQQAIDEQQQANPARFFASVNLPKYLARHPEDGVFGSSKLK